MAFLVVYEQPGSVPTFRNRALYLNQDFYRALCELWSDSSFVGTLLFEISKLGYGDELILGMERMNELEEQIEQSNLDLGTSTKGLSALKAAIQSARQRNLVLVVSGDMYPVID